MEKEYQLKHESEGDDSSSKDLDGASKNMNFDDFNDYDLFVPNSNKMNNKQQFDAYLMNLSYLDHLILTY